MKKLWKKIEHNKFLFAIFMIIVFTLFDFITTGFSGAFEHFRGIVSYINKLPNETHAGKSIFGEMIWALCLIPVILIFKNKYIFNQKKIPFKERFKVMWPMLLVTFGMLIAKFCAGGGFKHFNIDEVIALSLLSVFIGVYEEFLCRGWLLNEFIERFGKDRKGIIYSVILSSAIFGLMHFSNIFTGADIAGTIVQILMATLAGVFYASVYLKTKNIWSVVFLHAFWDFAVSISAMNASTACFEASIYYEETGIVLILLTIIAGLVNIFYQLPGLFESFKIFTKSSVNEMVPQRNKVELSEIQKAADKSAIKTFSIIQVVLTCIICTLFILQIRGYDADKCMQYEKKYITGMEATVISYQSYDMLYDSYNSIPISCSEDGTCVTTNYSETYNIKVEIDDNRLKFSDTRTNKGASLDFDEEIYDLAVYKDNGKYIIIVLVRCESGIETYYGYSTIKNMNSDNTLENITSSFKKVELPIVTRAGYFTELDSKYPLFISFYNDYYVMLPDGSIRILELETKD